MHDPLMSIAIAVAVIIVGFPVASYIGHIGNVILHFRWIRDVRHTRLYWQIWHFWRFIYISDIVLAHWIFFIIWIVGNCRHTRHSRIVLHHL